MKIGEWLPTLLPTSRLSQRSPTVGLDAATPPDYRTRTRCGTQEVGLGGRDPKGIACPAETPGRNGRVTVPLHAGETIGPGLLRSILAQAGITVEELRAAL
jgi:hypothetical protein